MPRWFDIAVACIGLVLFLPVLAIAAVAIKLDDRDGPVFYRQRRIGRDGKEFEIFKLRTMIKDSDPQGVGTVVTRDDPRLTRVGKLLRRTSLDEIPNLLNVLRGEMAIVGPRPTIPAQVAEYTTFKHRRHEILPGITGWAQIKGRAGLNWDPRIVLDVWYVDNRSVHLDLYILAKTLGLMVTGKGVAAD